MGRTIADLGALAVVSAALLATPALAGKKNDTLNIAWDQPLDIADAYYNTSREGILAARMIWDQLIERDPIVRFHDFGMQVVARLDDGLGSAPAGRRWRSRAARS